MIVQLNVLCGNQGQWQNDPIAIELQFQCKCRLRSMKRATGAEFVAHFQWDGQPEIAPVERNSILTTDDHGAKMKINPTPAFKKKKKKLKPAERRIKLRESLWPDLKTGVWTRHENDGYITIPKLLSHVCGLLKILATNDPTRVYIDLWCRSYDEGVIERIDEDEAAFSSGYVGTRAKRTWTEHIYELEKLGFIKVASDGNNAIGHVLLLNPLVVVDELRKKKKVTDEWWNAYVARASIIGAVLPSDEESELPPVPEL